MRIVSIFVLAIFMCTSLTANASDDGPEVISIRGLHLGMSLDDGAEIIKRYITPDMAKKLGEGEPLEVAKIPPFETCNYGFGFFPYGCPKIFLRSDCSPKKRVYQISIHNDVADKMYDSELLSEEEFVKVIEHCHNITMKPKVQPHPVGRPPVKSWGFESRHGYKVTITEGHTIIVEELPK